MFSRGHSDTRLPAALSRKARGMCGQLHRPGNRRRCLAGVLNGICNRCAGSCGAGSNGRLGMGFTVNP